MIGEVIGNFRLVSSLGRGGAGEVFLAEHTGIHTKVAVKVLHAEVSRETDQVQRFFNEARIVGKIKHAGIVKVFDVGFHGANAYLIMEFLEGESLRARLQRGPLALTDLLEVSRQIASVLDSTHRAGVTHRDLKPDNIFLVADDDLDGRERVKVLDFGIAKLADTLATGMTPRTEGTIGTPTYMAPEQWSDSSNVTWAVDAYALGCVMFELACGRPPFVAASIAEACAKHLTKEPPRASELRRDLPPQIDQLIARLLAKEPSARGASMTGIAAELAAATGRATPVPGIRIAESTPVALSDVTLDTLPAPAMSRTTLGGSSGQLASALPRKRAKLAIGGGLVAVATIGVIAFAMRGSQTPASRPAAVAPATPSATPEPSAPAPVPDPAPVREPASEPVPAPAAEPPPQVVPPTPEGSDVKPTAPAKRPRHHAAPKTRGATPPADKPAVIDLDGDGIPDTR